MARLEFQQQGQKLKDSLGYIVSLRNEVGEGRERVQAISFMDKLIASLLPDLVKHSTAKLDP